MKNIIFTFFNILHFLFDSSTQLLARLGAAHTDLSFAERKGAALGLAGVIKGLKIAALKKHNVMTALTALVETKGHPGARQVRVVAGRQRRIKNETV
jgi:hypothetical protein